VSADSGRVTTCTVSPRTERLVKLLCAAYYLIAATAIAWTKATFTDEGWFVGIACRLAHTGHMGSPTLVPWGFSIWLPQVHDFTYWEMPGFFLVWAPWLRVAGCGLFAARVLSVILGLFLILIWYRIVLYLTGRKDVALLALVLCSVDLMTVVRCSQARMDALSVFVTFSAFLVYLSQRRKSLGRAVFLGHLLAAAGMMVHPNGIFGVAGIIILQLYYDRKQLTPKLLLYTAVAYLIVGSAYGVYVLQAPHVWQTQLGQHSAGRFSGVLHPLRSITAEIRDRYYHSFGFSPDATPIRKPLILTLVPYFAAPLLCLLSGRIRRLPGAMVLLSLFLVIQIYFTFFEAGKYYAYLLHIMPYYTCFVAICSVYLVGRYPRVRTVLGLGLGGFILFQMGGALMMIRQNLAYNVYEDVASRVDKTRLVRDNETVQASSEFAFQFGFDRVKDDLTSRYLATARPLYAIIASGASPRVQGVAEKWADRVNATLSECYTGPQAVGRFLLYQRKDTCAPGRDPEADR